MLGGKIQPFFFRFQLLIVRVPQDRRGERVRINVNRAIIPDRQRAIDAAKQMSVEVSLLPLFILDSWDEILKVIVCSLAHGWIQALIDLLQGNRSLRRLLQWEVHRKDIRVGTQALPGIKDECRFTQCRDFKRQILATLALQTAGKQHAIGTLRLKRT